MTELLLRRFVRDHENTGDPDVRQRYGTFSGIVGIVCNLVLFAFKYLAGTLAGVRIRKVFALSVSSVCTNGR